MKRQRLRRQYSFFYRVCLPLPTAFSATIQLRFRRSFPSTKDAQWAARCPGQSTAHVISAAPYKWFAPWADGADDHG